MPQLNTAEAVAASLVANGIDTLFCLPGVQNDPFFDALYDAHERDPADPCAPRAGLRLHGAGLGHGDRQAVRPIAVVPGPGFLNTHGGAVDGLRA